LWTEDDQVRVGVAKPLSETEKFAQSLREDMIPVPEPKTTTQSPAYVVGTEHFLQASAKDAQWTQDADIAANRPRLPAPGGPPPQRGSSQQEPAPFRFRVQKPSSTDVPHPGGGWNLGGAPNPAPGDVLSYGSNGASSPVPPVPASIPYFNPPALSPSTTQLSDSAANTTVSDNFVPGALNAPTPHMGGPPNPHPLTRENSIGHFDWDQWDAVFGQHVPVDDPMMDMDWEEEHKAAGERKDDMDLYGNQPG
jgi:hypothetical protein